jgi:2-keto-4-pentenoate hydratase/2-oxohepta-3-ene-1,7-dioic acid hydratase in catechol pathway
MRLLTFEINGASRLGVVAADNPGTLIDATPANIERFDLMTLVASDEPMRRYVERSVTALDVDVARIRRMADVRLLPPLPRPGKLLCLAGNYRKHIVESGFQAPAEADVVTPQFFLKPSSSLAGPHDEILLTSENVSVGWEVELAVVIGRRGRHIPASSAMEYVFGYTVLNDISERGLHSQLQGRRVRDNDKFFDWLAGKWFDGFAPCGPWIVTADEIPDPHALGIRLWVNGVLRQEGTTAEMIFRIPETIAAASSIMTLEPGDIISTGTPAGAGVGGTSTLADGDEVVCEIDRIGRLSNRVRQRL